jgi:predicted DNA-binding transcriptional regulator AlpA
MPRKIIQPKPKTPAEAAEHAKRKRERRAARLDGFSLDARVLAGGLVCFEEVQQLIPKHRTWFHRAEKDGRFPKHSTIGSSVFWKASDIKDFLTTATS